MLCRSTDKDQVSQCVFSIYLRHADRSVGISTPGVFIRFFPAVSRAEWYAGLFQTWHSNCQMCFLSLSHKKEDIWQLFLYACWNPCADQPGCSFMFDLFCCFSVVVIMGFELSLSFKKKLNTTQSPSFACVCIKHIDADSYGTTHKSGFVSWLFGTMLYCTIQCRNKVCNITFKIIYKITFCSLPIGIYIGETQIIVYKNI